MNIAIADDLEKDRQAPQKGIEIPVHIGSKLPDSPDPQKTLDNDHCQKICRLAIGRSRDVHSFEQGPECQEEQRINRLS